MKYIFLNDWYDKGQYQFETIDNSNTFKRGQIIDVVFLDNGVMQTIYNGIKYLVNSAPIIQYKEDKKSNSLFSFLAISSIFFLIGISIKKTRA